MIPLINNANVDLSDVINYPFGRIKDNTGAGNGTPVNRNVYGDLHVNIAKIMALYGILPNVQPDNETNGYQIIEALIALSSKNTIVSDISTTGGVLVAAMKLSFLKVGEVMYCKSSCNFTTETTIKGTNPGSPSYALTVVDAFNIDDYVYLIRTSSGVEVRRIVDESNLDAVVASYNYLKAAVYADELAATSNAVATNPLSNALIFVERVNGASSAMSLANAARNGLYPKEHWAIVDALAANAVRNIGSFTGFDVEQGTVGSTYTCTGDVVSATIMQQADNTTRVRIVVANSMSGTDYYVRHFIQGNSANMFDDNTIGNLIFKPIDATTFDIALREFTSTTQSLKIHLEVVKTP